MTFETKSRNLKRCKPINRDTVSGIIDYIAKSLMIDSNSHFDLITGLTAKILVESLTLSLTSKVREKPFYQMVDSIEMGFDYISSVGDDHRFSINSNSLKLNVHVARDVSINDNLPKSDDYQKLLDIKDEKVFSLGILRGAFQCIFRSLHNLHSKDGSKFKFRLICNAFSSSIYIIHERNLLHIELEIQDN